MGELGGYMEIYYTIVLFVFGAVLGSFYNVVGYRLPKGESLLFPSSHCTKCKHKLGASELVPIFSYLFLGGKCKNCGQKISLFYPIFELSSGLLFAISYVIFGFSIELAIALTFISAMLIIIISDYQTMIIPDEVLLFGSALLIIEIWIASGWQGVLTSCISGILAFLTMFALKKIGDFLFKKESMGGGDLKLMFVFGLTLGYAMAIVSIFIASFIALPVAVYYTYRYGDKKYIEDDDIPEHSIPFGPFLAIASILLLLSQIDFDFIVKLLTRS